ncbi:hypothetical protein F0L68_35460 [Solihabitans fulvus]|uniref:ParB-like N-terminal domain-containing protein n=1 Tax=Solihabitans fulvus TaxID=1892852 RepID=A0A5B2WN04_9PSEU|nr:ParB N-terminal domain-containing protein [Solihabitans fulvus]KAA2252354.1 hypothetical protein F0L68_35460 [Solihabitans fulvus]
MTTTESPDAAIPAARTEQPAPTLLHVDPRTLVVEANVRTEARLDKDFVATIREHGVLTPIRAWRAQTGELTVVMGKRRTLGAIEAGCQTVPVHVVEAPSAEAARIVFQLIENDHRTALRDAERAQAYHQLSLLGMPAALIARRTCTHRKQVDTALRVGASELAAKAIDRFELTLDQAATLVEFEDDTEAVKALTVAAKKRPDQFEHIAQRLRDERRDTAARADLAAHLAEAGATVIDPISHDDHKARRLDELLVSQEVPSALTPDVHKDCPGDAAFVSEQGWGEHRTVVAVFVCRDWQAHGHMLRYPTATSGVKQPMTEADKLQRRTTIANNKAWDSAVAVRERWLTGFLAGKTPPKDAQRWIAVMLAKGSHALRRAMEDGHATAAKLLRLRTKPATPAAGANPVSVAASKAGPERATMITLAVLLAGLEKAVTREAWRNPTEADRDYFTALQHWGYPLSDVEQLVITPPVGVQQDAQ